MVITPFIIFYSIYVLKNVVSKAKDALDTVTSKTPLFKILCTLRGNELIINTGLGVKK